jgi:hypothetical protein
MKKEMPGMPRGNIGVVIDRFNFVSRWVSTEIVTADTIDHRLVLINRFLIIATVCAANMLVKNNVDDMSL